MIDQINAHVIEEGTGRMLAKPRMGACPRVGDEIRIADEVYCCVKRVVWVLDEDQKMGQRVNIGVIRV